MPVYIKTVTFDCADAMVVARFWAAEIQWFQLAAEMDAAAITELHTNRDGIVRGSG
jgi:hypothetical protein